MHLGGHTAARLPRDLRGPIFVIALSAGDYASADTHAWTVKAIDIHDFIRAIDHGPLWCTGPHGSRSSLRGLATRCGAWVFTGRRPPLSDGHVPLRTRGRRVQRTPPRTHRGQDGVAFSRSREVLSHRWGVTAPARGVLLAPALLKSKENHCMDLFGWHFAHSARSLKTLPNSTRTRRSTFRHATFNFMPVFL